jgi:hypothetical protein
LPTRPAETVVAAVAARAKRENFILMVDEIEGLTICERREGGKRKEFWRVLQREWEYGLVVVLELGPKTTVPVRYLFG